MTSPIRVLAADDQRVVRDGLAMLLGLLPGVEVVGSAADGEEALAMVAELHPDVVLMDLRMPRMDGVEATRRLQASDPDVKVVVLTTFTDDRSVIDALRAGALGYLTKDAGAEEILEALRRVTSGQAALDPVVQRHLIEAIAGGVPPETHQNATSHGATSHGATSRGATNHGATNHSATNHSDPGPAAQAAAPAAPAEASLPDRLTPREAEVLALIGEGLSNTEIATRLFVSEATVKSHINHLLAKIDARDRAQAVAYAYRHGLVR